jgi:hypothetical protein
MELARTTNTEILLHDNAIAPLNRLYRPHLFSNYEIGTERQSGIFRPRLPVDREEWQRVISEVHSEGSDCQVNIEGDKEGVL